MNRFKSDTAVSLITCDRPEMFLQSLQSIDTDCTDVFVVNAGGDLGISNEDLKKKYNVVEVIRGKTNPEPVGIAKNRALRMMRHSGYKYLFLMEDDVEIKNNNVFQRYIETAADSGLWAGQLSYGTHGGIKGGNVDASGNPKVLETVKYDKSSVNLYLNSLQAFTLYHANTIKVIGYMDEVYVNAAEHLDHYFNSFLNGLGSYFWYFPDIENSWKFLADIDSNHDKSVIRSRPDWNINFKKAWNLFKSKYGYYPDKIPRASIDKVMERLDFIESNYSVKDLLKE